MVLLALECMTLLHARLCSNFIGINRLQERHEETKETYYLQVLLGYQQLFTRDMAAPVERGWFYAHPRSECGLYHVRAGTKGDSKQPRHSTIRTRTGRDRGMHRWPSGLRILQERTHTHA